MYRRSSSTARWLHITPRATTDEIEYTQVLSYSHQRQRGRLQFEKHNHHEVVIEPTAMGFVSGRKETSIR
jgi:hypothetical protein